PRRLRRLSRLDPWTCPPGYADPVFGINGMEFLVLLVVAVVVIGPDRLPRYAEQLGRGARALRGFIGTAKERVSTELGEQAPDVDWASLDPRRYDPRRIVREALLDEPDATRTGGAAGAVGLGAHRSGEPGPEPHRSGVAEELHGPAPYDD